MCLTIPKKVISIEGNNVVVENPAGDRQTVKSIVELNAGDFCLTQQNVAIERVDEKYYKEVFNILKGEFHEKENEINSKRNSSFGENYTELSAADVQ